MMERKYYMIMTKGAFNGRMYIVYAINDVDAVVTLEDSGEMFSSEKIVSVTELRDNNDVLSGVVFKD